MVSKLPIIWKQTVCGEARDTTCITAASHQQHPPPVRVSSQQLFAQDPAAWLNGLTVGQRLQATDHNTQSGVWYTAQILEIVDDSSEEAAAADLRPRPASGSTGAAVRCLQ